MIAWDSRVQALVATLVDGGHLTDRRWRDAFEQTPRHLFVPRFYSDDHSLVDGHDPGQRASWLDAVYSDTSLVTQLTDVPGADLHWPTSSSTMPSLMARMLALLQVADDSRVLEIGTATGYNAALLCHRLGSKQVASVEIHPGLAAEAATRLDSLGYHPTLAVADGALGLPGNGRYDRIIATCAVSAVPPGWIEQLSLGGVIVSDLRGEMASSLAVLRKIGPATVQGQLLDRPGHFMWLRPDPGNPLRDAGRCNLVVHHSDSTATTTGIDLRILDEPGFRVLLTILEPAVGPPSRSQRDGLDVLFLYTNDGAWAEITATATGHAVAEGGPRRIWPAVERAATEWNRLGRPGRGRFGITATTDGTHRYWMDNPTRAILDDADNGTYVSSSACSRGAR